MPLTREPRTAEARGHQMRVVAVLASVVQVRLVRCPRAWAWPAVAPAGHARERLPHAFIWALTYALASIERGILVIACGLPETTWSPPQSPLQEQRIRIRVSHVPFDKPSPGWSWPIGDPSRSMIDRCSVVRECVRVDFFSIFQEGR